MNTNAICPISNKKIDENAARLNGGFTVLLLITFLFTQNILPILILLGDFLLRSVELSAYSPLANLSKVILNVLKVQKNLINAGPKIFAARIGFIFALTITISSITDLFTISYAATIIFGICAFLEAAIGFCVACQIYPFVLKLTNTTRIVRS